MNKYLCQPHSKHYIFLYKGKILHFCGPSCTTWTGIQRTLDRTPNVNFSVAPGQMFPQGRPPESSGRWSLSAVGWKLYIYIIYNSLYPWANKGSPNVCILPAFYMTMGCLELSLMIRIAFQNQGWHQSCFLYRLTPWNRNYIFILLKIWENWFDSKL